MSSRRWTWSLWGASALVVSLSAGSCSSGAGGSGGGAHGDAGKDATAAGVSCATNADCTAQLPTTTPPDCATATCNALQGVCVFSAKDQDGDGHPAANCKSTTSVAIQAGDDCNDNDANLYPGHPEACSTSEDGGTPVGTLCAQGQITCQADGTESACTGTVACVNQTCVSGGCLGSCVAGQALCLGNGVALCSSSAMPGASAACLNQTCVKAAGGGTSSASCEGVCAPGQQLCDGTQPETCGADGQWHDMGSACAGSSPACTNGVCGMCTPTAPGCNGPQPQQCNAAGTGWEDMGGPCTSACLGGSCVACNPGSARCGASEGGANPSIPQACDATGNWQDSAAACVGQTCVVSPDGDAGGIIASCLGVCAPGQTQCSANGIETCQSDGTWSTASACVNQTCVGGVGSDAGSSAACQGQCAPGQIQCTSATQPQTCSPSGAWQNEAPCSGSAPACTAAGCVAGPPSCQGADAGLTNCGQTSESCCASLEVPAGTFYRTYANGGDGGVTSEADPASVSGFRLDKYLVTVGRFRQFLNAWNGGSGWTPPAGSGKHAHLNGGLGLVDTGAPSGGGAAYESGWLTSNNGAIQATTANLTSCTCMEGSTTVNCSAWSSTPDGSENLPINCVNWYEAYAFCIWDGGFLPSEGEWEYAAAGGIQQREFPWGAAAPSSQFGANNAVYDCLYGEPGPLCRGLGSLAPVGSGAGVGLWGQYDLAGEVYEWAADWYAPYVDPSVDAACLTATTGRDGPCRVLRGGSFYDDNSGDLLSSNRLFTGLAGEPPGGRSTASGLRCARVP